MISSLIYDKPIKPYINMIKDEDSFKKELNNMIYSLCINESFDVLINEKMMTLKKVSEKKLQVYEKKEV